MSISDTSQPLPGITPADTVGEPVERRKFDAVGLLKDSTFQMVMLVLAATVFCFWPLLYQEVWKKWMDMEGYYAHGLLIPVCSAYLVWDKWDKLKQIVVKPQFWAAVLLIPILYSTYAASRSIMPSLLSGLLITTLLVGTLIVAGWKWLMALFAPVLFLFLGMPVWDKLIDTNTMHLQLWSYKIALKILQITGFEPYSSQDNVIFVPHFSQPLQIAVACSGLRTTIAISAAVVFFVLMTNLDHWYSAILEYQDGAKQAKSKAALVGDIAKRLIKKMRWIAIIALLAAALPLSILINGIRIAMIGMVANSAPEWSGENFKMMHDISGYVALGICFVALGWISKKLGYK
ncbi:MAG: exosortase/archaeosortase family protein [Armatimonadetes bacterium]|nr:exosortase/archaeosortase family protein [Armatimonadota bacterium]